VGKGVERIEGIPIRRHRRHVDDVPGGRSDVLGVEKGERTGERVGGERESRRFIGR